MLELALPCLPAGRRCCVSILCSYPGAAGCCLLLGFRATRAAQAVSPPSTSPPAAFNIAVRAEWHREKRGEGIWRRSLHSIRNYVCVLLSAQTLLLSSQPEKHLRFVVPVSPPANHCPAIAVSLQPWFSSDRRCGDEPSCAVVLSSALGKQTLLCT